MIALAESGSVEELPGVGLPVNVAGPCRLFSRWLTWDTLAVSSTGWLSEHSEAEIRRALATAGLGLERLEIGAW